MLEATEVELRANWNGAIFTGIPAEQLSKLRLWLFGGGGLLVLLGVMNLLVDNPLIGFSTLFMGVMILFVGVVVEVAKNKQSLKGTSIDFHPNYVGYLTGMLEQFLRYNQYHYRSVQEDLRVVRGDGFELHPSGIRLIVFDVKAPLSGRVLRLGLRNVNEQNHQEAILLQIKLDDYFVYNNLIGKNPFSVRTRYHWDGIKYTPMR